MAAVGEVRGEERQRTERAVAVALPGSGGRRLRCAERWSQAHRPTVGSRAAAAAGGSVPRGAL